MERMLQAMEVFTRIVECGNFTRASDLMGIPKASTSLLIQQLEAHLQVTLLHRTTRQVKPTPIGVTYYDHCLKILHDITDMRSRIGTGSHQARGRLRVELPGDIARLTVPQLERFQRDFPAINLHIATASQGTDLIRDAIDCTVKVGALDDSSSYSRRVGSYQLVTVASRAYLSRNGTPRTPADLATHRTAHICRRNEGRATGFAFERNGSLAPQELTEAIAFSDKDLLLQYALMDAGIVQVWDAAARPFLAKGRLQEILPAFRPTAVPIHAVYSCRTRESACLRVFVDWLAQALEGPTDRLQAYGNARPAYDPEPAECKAASDMMRDGVAAA